MKTTPIREVEQRRGLVGAGLRQIHMDRVKREAWAAIPCAEASTAVLVPFLFALSPAPGGGAAAIRDC